MRPATNREYYLVFKCYSNHRENGKIKSTTFEEKEIDEFLVWKEDQEKVYRLTIDQTSDSEIRLRLQQTKNNQSKKH